MSEEKRNILQQRKAKDEHKKWIESEDKRRELQRKEIGEVESLRTKYLPTVQNEVNLDEEDAEVDLDKEDEVYYHSDYNSDDFRNQLITWKKKTMNDNQRKLFDDVIREHFESIKLNNSGFIEFIADSIMNKLEYRKEVENMFEDKSIYTGFVNKQGQAHGYGELTIPITQYQSQPNTFEGKWENNKLVVGNFKKHFYDKHFNDNFFMYKGNWDINEVTLRNQLTGDFALVNQKLEDIFVNSGGFQDADWYFNKRNDSTPRVPRVVIGSKFGGRITKKTRGKKSKRTRQSRHRRTFRKKL